MSLPLFTTFTENISFTLNEYQFGIICIYIGTVLVFLMKPDWPVWMKIVMFVAMGLLIIGFVGRLATISF